MLSDIAALKIEFRPVITRSFDSDGFRITIQNIHHAADAPKRFVKEPACQLLHLHVCSVP